MDSRENQQQRLQSRLAVYFVALALIASTLVNLTWFLMARAQLRESVNSSLRQMVTLAAPQVNAEDFKSLDNPDDINSPAYRRSLDKLNQLLATDYRLQYIYTMRLGPDGTIQFVVDTDQENPGYIGMPYPDAGPVLKANFATMNQTMIEEKIYMDSWGSYLSAYAPFYDSEGNRLGVIAIDMSAKELLKQENMLLAIALGLFLITAVIMSMAGWWLGQWVVRPINKLTEGVLRVAAGDLSYKVDVKSNDEIGILADAFNQMSTQVRENVEELDQRVQVRTQELDARSQMLEAAAVVAQAANSIIDAEHLTTEVVDIVRRQFHLYYVGLFLVDEDNEYAMLRAGTGKAGQAMLARGHKIKVGSGMIGWSISNSQARVALEADEDQVRLATSELPDTKSEAAIPLRSRSKVIGALSVQSDRPNAFDSSVLVVLQTMADLVAVALENARLFAQSQESLEAIRRAYGELSRQAWSQLLRTRQVAGYTCNQRGVAALAGGEMQATAESPENGLPWVSVPIRIRGEELGVLEAHKPGENGEWNEQELNLLQTLVDQLGVALESARLYQETQRRAERERLAGEITAKMRATNDPQMVLQTAVQELREALQARRGQILLRSRSAEPPAAEAADTEPIVETNPQA